MIPKPIRLTKIVRKMMKSGRVTESTFYNLRTMARHFPVICAALAVVVGPVSASNQEPPRVAPQHVTTMRPEIIGTHGIVAGGRHYSVAAGIRILEQGGNAVDAGVATVLAASVVEISHFGFGGESPLMIYDAHTGEIIVINGQGPAPKAAAPA